MRIFFLSSLLFLVCVNSGVSSVRVVHRHLRVDWVGGPHHALVAYRRRGYQYPYCHPCYKDDKCLHNFSHSLISPSTDASADKASECNRLISLCTSLILCFCSSLH